MKNRLGVDIQPLNDKALANLWKKHFERGHPQGWFKANVPGLLLTIAHLKGLKTLEDL